MGGIDFDAGASDAFAQRLQAAEMGPAVVAWLEANPIPVRCRRQRFSGVRCGGVRGVALDRVGELAELIGGFYRKAMVGLPLSGKPAEAALEDRWLRQSGEAFGQRQLVFGAGRMKRPLGSSDLGANAPRR